LLESITLENFQAHTLWTLDLDPHVTCIVGPTNSGKSSLIRLLRWIAHNKPSGDAFRTKGTDFVRGTLRIDGHTVIRHRGKTSNGKSGNGKSGNYYEIDGERLDALKTNEAPEPVAKILNLCEDNFALQHDPSFWFHLTPGQLARELDRIIDLGSIDETLTDINQQIRQNKSSLLESSNRLQEAQEASESLSWVSGACDVLDALQARQEALDTQTEHHRFLEDAVRDAEQFRNLLGFLDTVSGPLTDLRDRVLLVQEYIHTKNELESLCGQGEGLLQEQESLQERIDSLNSRLQAVKICPLCRSTL